MAITLKKITEKRIPSGEWYAEWALEGYEDYAVHGMSFAAQADILPYEPSAEAALVEVLRSCHGIEP